MVCGAATLLAQNKELNTDFLMINQGQYWKKSRLS